MDSIADAPPIAFSTKPIAYWMVARIEALCKKARRVASELTLVEKAEWKTIVGRVPVRPFFDQLVVDRRGLFWLPNAPEAKVPGILTVQAGEGARIEIFGEFAAAETESLKRLRELRATNIGFLPGYREFAMTTARMHPYFRNIWPTLPLAATMSFLAIHPPY